MQYYRGDAIDSNKREVYCTQQKCHNQYNNNIHVHVVFLPCAHAQGVKQSVYPSVVVVVVVVGTKIARSRVLGICVSCKQNLSVDIGVVYRARPFLALVLYARGGGSSKGHVWNAIN